ncbi:hypothetical protein Psch_03050 [Pelotomaculum schinkii]|uniref:Uncharacterized protein n=1 Tax=Pelotomaculum schinkii TaxID=78350 RepID=A0A4Y7RAK2_9FIRM|nr:hypothetical protein Psch_03050 [Pelotomaculum schinkii]TEB13942.1 hypothetical protein Psfp_03292 [Pelotomaculum sp. FP]
MLRLNRLVYVLTFFILNLPSFSGTQNIVQNANLRSPIISNPLNKGEYELKTSFLNWPLKKQFLRLIVLLLIYSLVLWKYDYLFGV